ncbi:MAG: cytochrome C [Candidatus Electrothrix sp. MAN1_4]|nr:cytochrome C [Candidatus Electrothrix sp. MAN1_4]
MKLSVIGLAVACLLVAGSASASEELATSNNCMICHKVDAKLMGPSFKEVAARYKDDAEGAATLVKSIREGTKDKWGGAPMMAQKQVSEADAKTLAEWIMSLGQ